MNSFERCGARGPLFVFFVCKHSPPSRSDFLIYLPTLSSSAQSTSHKLDILICNASQQNQRWTRPPFTFTGLPSISKHHNVISRHISHIQAGLFFYSTPHRGRVYKWKFCPFIYLFVCSSVITSYSFPFLSDSKLRRVTQPLPQYPMSPIHVSHARQSIGPPFHSIGPPSQSTDPPMNRIISRTFLSHLGSSYVST